MEQTLQPSVAERRCADLRAWLVVAAAAAVWLIAYRGIKPLADWLTFGLLGLAPASRLGEARAAGRRRRPAARARLAPG